MTKEELKKEAEEKASIYFDSLEVDNGNVSNTPFSAYDVFVAYEKGALEFAEPREKRIAELEAQIEKVKHYLDYDIPHDLINEATTKIWRMLEQGERRMTKEELEKEAEEYANNLTFVFETDIVQRIVRERVRLALIDVLEPREKRIEELEKENAELKKLKRECETSLCRAEYQYNYEQLTKAKELLERLLITSCNSDVLNLLPNCSEVLRVRVEAEQFLKDN